MSGFFFIEPHATGRAIIPGPFVLRIASLRLGSWMLDVSSRWKDGKWKMLQSTNQWWNHENLNLFLFWKKKKLCQLWSITHPEKNRINQLVRKVAKKLACTHPWAGRVITEGGEEVNHANHFLVVQLNWSNPSNSTPKRSLVTGPERFPSSAMQSKCPSENWKVSTYKSWDPEKWGQEMYAFLRIVFS